MCKTIMRVLNESLSHIEIVLIKDFFAKIDQEICLLNGPTKIKFGENLTCAKVSLKH